MIRELLKSKGIILTDDEFSEVMTEVTNDIIENRYKLGVRSNKAYLLRTAIAYYGILKRLEA